MTFAFSCLLSPTSTQSTPFKVVQNREKIAQLATTVPPLDLSTQHRPSDDAAVGPLDVLGLADLSSR